MESDAEAVSPLAARSGGMSIHCESDKLDLYWRRYVRPDLLDQAMVATEFDNDTD